jgi:mono/diheme cytochrome c family protein
MNFFLLLCSNRSKLVVISLLALLIAAGCRFYFKTTTGHFAAVSNSSSFERGKNLAYNICAGCHYDHQANKFMGKALHDLPRIAGRLYSANLTSSATNGIPPLYTDAELFYLLRTGIARNGRFMPYMMRPMMADDDINDLIVYLRSDDPALAAVDTTVGKTFINLVGKTGIRLGAKPQPYATQVPRPSENDPIAYGRYLVAVIGCYHCHSSKVLGLDYKNPEQSKGYMSGGIKLKDPQGKRLYGPNLTPDKETGIGNFTKMDFRNAVREGTTPSGRKLSPPMGKFDHLTDQQVDAIYSYLQSLPARHHTIKRRAG